MAQDDTVTQSALIPLAIVRWVQFFVPILGIGITAALTVSHFQRKPLPCGVGTGCDEVMYSKYAYIGSLPVALLGLVFYLALGILIFTQLSARPSIAKVMFRYGYALAAIGACVSIGFTLLAVLVVRTTCSWCLASTVTACVGVASYALLAERADDASYDWLGRRGQATFLVLAIGFALCGILLGNYRPNLPPLLNVGRLEKMPRTAIWPESAPFIGSRKATLQVAMFGDFTCGLCANQFPVLVELARAGKLGLTFRHYPLQQSGVAYAGAIIAESAKGSGLFWDIATRIYEKKPKSMAALIETCVSAGLSQVRIERELLDGKSEHQKQVATDRGLAKYLQIIGTPALVIWDAKASHARWVPLREIRIKANE